MITNKPKQKQTTIRRVVFGNGHFVTSGTSSGVANQGTETPKQDEKAEKAR